MSRILFASWHQWKVCYMAGIRSLAWGLYRLATCIILGIVSLLWYCARIINGFCGREPVAFAIIGILSIGWIATYVNSSVSLRHAIDQRDSVSIRLDRYMQAYEKGKTLIINGDTIRK